VRETGKEEGMTNVKSQVVLDINLKLAVQYQYSHDPGVRTFRNGDPGYPPTTEIDIEHVFIVGEDERGRSCLQEITTPDSKDAIFPDSVLRTVEEVIETHAENELGGYERG
jgi:hypothetical protein